MSVIEVRNLKKTYDGIEAVKGISFDVEEGEIFGFLGPNGAGKSTTINMLCTLLQPTSGEAYLNGHEISKDPVKVRQSIGIVFQDPSLDDALTALENLRFSSILYNLPGEERKRRIQEILALVELEDRKNDIVKTFSGGMKRRLEIARGLLHYPKILFLDEPTVGLDPQTRTHIWQHLHELRNREKITVFLTTHYMDEAENCDRIAIIDHGQIVALDTPQGLKNMVGGDIVSLRVNQRQEAKAFIEGEYNFPVLEDEEGLHFEVDQGEEFIPAFMRRINFPIQAVSLRKPTIDDVFLKITGREIRDEEVSAKDARIIRKRMRRRR